MQINFKYSIIVLTVIFAALIYGCEVDYPDNSDENTALSLTDFGDNWERIVNLKGIWKFSISDSIEFSQPTFDDENWDNIKTPNSWENVGFHGYDGYAWYRKTFFIPENLKGKSAYIKLGYIDDVDQVFINGNLIGSSGNFPPNYKTAYNGERFYFIPPKALNYNGENSVAVRVYDAELEGGISHGDLGIYIQDIILPDLNLEGEWKFIKGNSRKLKAEIINEKEIKNYQFETILVPGYWETQGYFDFDGFAWCRKEFMISENFKDKDLILLLGKIDDFDEAYLNGKLIGSTGDMSKAEEELVPLKQEWLEYRIYDIPKDFVKFESENILAVKVYDGYINGGIYSGPVGIIEKEKFEKVEKSLAAKRKRDRNLFDKVFNH